MVLNMPVNEQQQVAVAEGVAGPSQHVEDANLTDGAPTQHHQRSGTIEQLLLDAVGPWPLRRDSNSSRCVIRTPTSTRPSPATRATTNDNPFANAFAGVLQANNPFRNRNESEASGSPLVAGADVADMRVGNSKFTRAMEFADHTCQSVRHVLDAEAIQPRNDDAERRRYKHQRQTREQSVEDDDRHEQEGREQEPGPNEAAASPRASHVQWATPPTRPASLPTPQAPAPRDVERGTIVTIRELHLDDEDCRVCKQHAAAAMVGLGMLCFTAMIGTMSPIILWMCLREESVFLSQKLEEKHNTVLFIILMAFPFVAFCGMFAIAAMILTALGIPRYRLKSGKRFFFLWLGFVHFMLGIYLLIAGLIYKFSR